ncbi:MAG: hypothetical protein AAF919_16090 [Pseudomonadota bacterium]
MTAAPSETPSDPILTLRPSPARRSVGLMIQLGLGLLLLWIALAHPPEALSWRVFLLVLGGGALALSWRGWTGSAQAIVLDASGLRSETGEVIAPLSAVRKVDRSLFAIKPSNGFLVVLETPLGRAWRPGMWWRLGRHVGVGGVTGAAETKLVADTFSAMVAERDRA